MGYGGYEYRSNPCFLMHGSFKHFTIRKSTYDLFKAFWFLHLSDNHLSGVLIYFENMISHHFFLCSVNKLISSWIISIIIYFYIMSLILDVTVCIAKSKIIICIYDVPDVSMHNIYCSIFLLAPCITTGIFRYL